MRFLARFVFLMALPLLALAVPGTINYQGRLLDNNGIPVTGSYNFVVSIWSTASGASGKLYEENHSALAVNDGVYSFEIGGGTSPTPAWNPTSLFNTTAPRYVELVVNGETLTPRHRLLSAPFTLQSGNSDALGGQGINYFGTAATDANLQNQINSLSSQLSALQSLCEAGGNIWDSGENVCYSAIKVIDYQGKIVPVDQDSIELALPDLLQECLQKHYRPVMLLENPMEVLDCDSNPVENPQESCRFGAATSATIIKLQDCPLILEQQTPKG